MSNAEIIIQYCKKAGKPITARQIIDACFPGKPQPYINSTINNLVQLKSLIRNDDVRPYTVRIPMEGESVPEPRDYSKGNQTTRLTALENETKSAIKFTEKELQETARRVKTDPRYGEEAAIISSCFRKFPENNDGDIVAMKIALIDMTNSTNLNKHLSKIYLTRLIAKIKTCDFDERVAMGDTSLIAELAKNEINLFSFFSKYCLYHNYYVYQNDDFAIFDSVMLEVSFPVMTIRDKYTQE
ncbi:MAG: hypothetical protein FWG64_00925 [Firmicutes bacterium]|nr:hypothetical protein [Bacillota bacterium]